MGKTTCPQRQRTFLRCLPICFGGAAHFGLNSEWQAAPRPPRWFLQLEQVSVRVTVGGGEGGGDKANPIGSGSSLHSAGGSSSLGLTNCVSAGCLFVLERLDRGTNASPGASRVGGDGKPELPGVALLPRRWLGLVWTAAPVCFLRGKLRLCNH